MRRAPSRTATVLTVLLAVLGTTMTAGPVGDALADAPCGLPRAAVHHSEGLDSWNDEYPRPMGEVEALMVFLSFPDARPGISPATIAGDYFPATADFFHDASYGRLDLDVRVVEEWVEMPDDSIAYGIRRDWEPELRSRYLGDALEVLEPRVDLGGHDIVYLVADPDAPGVDSDATKVVNFDQPIEVGDTEIHRMVTLFERRPPDRNVLAHETGHVFDLPDLYHRPEDDFGDWDTHVGDWDLMGSQFGLAPEPLGWHKWKLGWLDVERIACVTAEGVSLHTLQPLTAPLDPAHPAADTRMAVVRTGPTEVLVAEARTLSGNDADACAEGVLVYRVRSDVASAEGPVTVLDGHPDSAVCHGTSVNPELADAPLATGESYYDAASGVRIEVLGRTASGGWDVKIVNGPALP